MVIKQKKIVSNDQNTRLTNLPLLGGNLISFYVDQEMS